MNPKTLRRSGAFGTLAASALCLALISGCNSSGASAPGVGSGIATEPSARRTTAASETSSTGTPTSTPVPPPAGTALTGESCVSSDPAKICLAVHFVSYKSAAGAPVADENRAAAIISGMNRFWSQCGIGFQIEKYDAVDPTRFNLAYGSAAQGQTTQIRATFAEPSNQLLAVTTGPWGTAVNAWTSMPGSPPYGAVMESSIVSYGDGIIYAHEFGHYLGLNHVGDTSNLMDAVIYTSSTVINSSQCQTARDTARGMWSAMLRS